MKKIGLIIFMQIFLSQCSGTAVPLSTTAPMPVPTSTIIPILMYHYIGDIPPDQKNNAIRIDLTVSQENFEAQLKWLSDNNFETIYFQRVLDFVNRGTQPLLSSQSKKPVVLSFDDGYDNAYSIAFPLLKKYGIHGSFAIITGKVGTPGYVTWPQLLEMQKGGMEILSHTVTHPDLSKISAKQLVDEVINSKKNLEAELNIKINAIVYPSGRYNQSVIDEARAADYEGARTTHAGVVTKNSKPFELPTVRIHGSTTMRQFSELF